MKIYLIALLFVIMGAGAYTMFEVAYQGMALEHDAAPNPETYFYIFTALWYVLMMVADILLLTHKSIRFKNALLGLFTLPVPILFKTAFMHRVYWLTIPRPKANTIIAVIDLFSEV